MLRKMRYTVSSGDNTMSVDFYGGGQHMSCGVSRVKFARVEIGDTVCLWSGDEYYLLGPVKENSGDEIWGRDVFVDSIREATKLQVAVFEATDDQP